ncbi:MAG: EamA/RhaT family transporter [Thermoprotei archaeon]|nr:MAG: EamA/RhaT family transporter [Thermoprotei archaeon]
MDAKYLKGILEMVLTTFIWGSVSLFAIWSKLPSPIFVFYRVLVASIFITLMIIAEGGISSLKIEENIKTVLISGVFLTLNWIFFFYAVLLTTVANATLLYYTGPVIAIVLAPIIAKEKQPGWVIAPVGMAMTGILLILSEGLSAGNPIGLFFGLLAGLSYGILAAIGKLASSRNRPEIIVLYQCLISIIILTPFLFVIDYSMEWITSIILIIVGVVHTALALRLWYSALGSIPMSLASILSYLDPVFAVLLAWIFLGQIPSLSTIIGGVLIITAGVLTTLLYNTGRDSAVSEALI